MNDSNFMPAPLYKRLIAFFIDAIVASLPAFVILYLFVASATYPPLPALYVTPVEGTLTIITLPIEVNQYMNGKLPTSENFGDTELRNVTFGATAARMASVAAILFYLLYSAVSTMFYDGETFGKHLMHISVKHHAERPFVASAALRELVGKVLLNSTVIVPIISVFTILFTKRHLAVHDMIAGTTVVSEEPISGYGFLDSFAEGNADDEETE